MVINTIAMIWDNTEVIVIIAIHTITTCMEVAMAPDSMETEPVTNMITINTTRMITLHMEEAVCIMATQFRNITAHLYRMRAVIHITIANITVISIISTLVMNFYSDLG
jgi:hypothetical protein